MTEVTRSSRIVPRLLIVCFVLAAPLHALASPVTFFFTGTVDRVSGGLLSSTFNTTQTMSGSYTFDSALVDSASPGDTLDGFYGPPSALSVTIGSSTATNGACLSISRCFIEVFLDGPPHTYEVKLRDMTGAAIAGVTPFQFSFLLEDSTNSAFTTDALPTTPPNLSDFDVDGRGWVMSFFNPSTGAGGGIGGTITSLTAATTEVPEPSTLPLLLTGLIGLTGLRKRV